jgi:hypothetical protein
MAEHEIKFDCTIKKGGGIKAVLITPFINKSDAQIIAESEPFMSIGNILTEEGESVHFGKDMIYTKLKQ